MLDDGDMRGLSHAGHNTRLIRPSMRLGVVNGIVECLENVVDALMSEIIDDAVYTAAELEEWQLNMERAITALSSQNKAVARMKARQCLRSCECTRECDGCSHEAARAVITMLLSL